MAPEHLEGFLGGPRPVDARSDVYALGVVLFEMLTGRPPFPIRDGSKKETFLTMIADRQGPPPALRPWNPSISPAVESIVRHCLEPEPENRYGSAKALMEDLELHLSNQTLKHAPDPSRRERGMKWVRRHRTLVRMAGVVALLATVGGGLGTAIASQKGRIERYEAFETLTRFDRDANDVLTRIHTDLRDPALKADGVALAMPALSTIGITTKDRATEWWERPPLSRLPFESRERVRDKIGEILLAAAWTEARSGENSGDADASARCYRIAVELCEESRHAFGEGRVPKALWEEESALFAKLNDSEKSSERATRANTTPTPTARDLYLAGCGLLYRGEISKALVLLEQAARWDPSNFWMMFHAGQAHYLQDHFIEAESYFTACISLRPDYPISWFYRAAIIDRRGDVTSAAADLDSGLTLRPEDPRALLERGILDKRRGRNAQAMVWLDRAVKAGGSNPRAYLIRGEVKTLLGDRDGAARDLETGLKLIPIDVDGWIARSVTHLGKHEFAEALTDLDEALKRNPGNELALWNKAGILSESLGKTAEAIAVLDRLIERQPGVARNWACRSTLNARIGRDDDAHADAEMALIKAQDPETRYRVAGTYALMSKRNSTDRDEALLHLRSGLNQGFGLDRVDDDSDLAPLRDDPEFRRIVGRAKAAKHAALPTGTSR